MMQIDFIEGDPGDDNRYVNIQGFAIHVEQHQENFKKEKEYE